MDKIIISENQVKDILTTVLSEEISKVKREDFNRVQFKIEELENSISETIKEFRKLESSIPANLQTVTKSKISGISSYLYNSQKLLTQLKEKVKQYKRTVFYNQIEEKKK